MNTTATSSDKRPSAHFWMRLTHLFAVYSRWILLASLLVVGAIVNNNFITYYNLANIARQASLLALISFGMTLAMLVRGLDLSVGSVVALSSVVAAPIIFTGHLIEGVLIGLGVGLLAGIVNSLMVANLGIPSFIATYGTLRVARGLALLYSGGLSVYGFATVFRQFGSGFLLRIPTPIYIALIVFGMLFFMSKYTTWGRSVFAVGANPTAARFSGFNVRKVLFSVYALSGLLSGLAGLIYIAYVNAADPSIGDLFPLDAIAVALVGGTTFSGGIGGMGNTLVGALIIAVLNTIMNLVNISSYWQDFAKGAVIVLALIFDLLLRRMTQKRLE